MILTGKSGGSPMSRLSLPARTRALFLVLLSLLVTVPALGLVMTAGGEAEAHP
jgi:chitin-binding protein